MTTDFKKRLNNALDEVVDNLNLDRPRVRRLYTPVWRARKYQWISPMDSDGLLIKDRIVHGDEKSDAKLRIGVIVQSEFATSNTKPNPFGKALVGKLPLGVWVDLDDERRRVRLDKVVVLFLLPQATHPDKKKVSATALSHVEDASLASDEAYMLKVPQGISSHKLAVEIARAVRPWLIGAGRPAVAEEL